MDFERYKRQLALPEITPADQTRLANAHILAIGAGGLGTASLPYLCAAGLGNLTIIDHDQVSLSNLHRQTIYTDAQTGQDKAKLAAQYCKSLNPNTSVNTIEERFSIKTLENFVQNQNLKFDLILDGSDNFETKILLNTLSIKTKTPLLSASVNQFKGQIGLFAGFAVDQPCYHCLFPELPQNAQNCNEAGILGTAAGLTGLWQAHLSLMFLLQIEDISPGTFIQIDFKNCTTKKLHIPKNPHCPACKNEKTQWHAQKKETHMSDLISMKDLQNHDHIIIDVRTKEEIEVDPIKSPTEKIIHIELSQIPDRYQELPTEKLLAFVCAGNIRSAQAAQYLKGIGLDADIRVLDKFSIR